MTNLEDDDERELSPEEVRRQAEALYASNLAWVRRREAARQRAEAAAAEAAQRDAEQHLECRADLSGDVWQVESLHAGAAAKKAGRDVLERIGRKVERRERQRREAAERKAARYAANHLPPEQRTRAAYLARVQNAQA